ncbi:hypothetical protein BDV39DRAFT_210011 [Aspergillus sergii]|uniref:MACPF domain-containing protein n=1 Tax=Aspergillus sergii TaxID=1034303 RepID=A0A5N6WMR9_9EURO|nr:hypothetical protein BDV39DRAFT_210011 [Aspergillus sergii]
MTVTEVNKESSAKSADKKNESSENMINISLFKDASNLEPIRHISLEENVNDLTLSKLRELLLNKNGLRKEHAQLPFCTTKGGTVPEATKVSKYQDILKNQESADNSATTGQYDVYLKDQKITSEIDATISKFLEEKLELAPKEDKAALLEAAPKLLTSSFDPGSIKASTGGNIIHPADMTERHWNVVTRTNSVLNGQTVKQFDVKRGAKSSKFINVERAVYTAFEVKDRHFEPYQISSSDKVEKIGQEQQLKIPRFRVADDSYVDVFESKDAVSSALARSSFSETAVEASAGGGFMGMSASVKVGYNESKESASAESSAKEKSFMNVSFNFPRVVLHLDADSLQVSKECDAELRKVVNQDSLMDFYDKFGRFFAKRVELGGRLYSREESTSVAEDKKSEEAEKMKAAASASFSSSFAQASASASHESQSKSSSQNSSSSMSRSITWEAQGGDTLLCNNPAAWCPTQDDIVSLPDMIGSIPNYEWVPRNFERASQFKGRVTFRLEWNNKDHEAYSGYLSPNSDLVEPPRNNNFEPPVDWKNEEEGKRSARPYVWVPTAGSTPAVQQSGIIVNAALRTRPLAQFIGKDDANFYEVRGEHGEKINATYLEYGKKYRILNISTMSWLSLTPPVPIATLARFLYYDTIARATVFQFEGLRNGGKVTDGQIADHDNVELWPLEDDGTRAGLVALLDNHSFPGFVGISPGHTISQVAWCKFEYGFTEI